MKKLLVCLSLALALVMIVPAPVIAAPQPFTANGAITGITVGTVQPAGNSGRWLVVEREVTGFLSGGGLDGQFSLVYKANVQSADTQAGNFHGRLTVGDNILQVNGKSAPIQMVFFAPFGVYLPVLSISGHFNILDGGNGNGDFEGYAVFIPTAGDHIGIIVDSAFTLSGKLK